MSRGVWRYLLILSILALLIAGCGGPPEVVYDYDNMADWSQYRAFNWLPGEATSQANPDEARIKRAVALDLTQRGYLQGGNGPMLLLSYQISYQGDKDMLTLEMVDDKSMRRLWTGTTELPKLQNDPQKDDASIQETVTRMLGYFPPPPPI